MTKAKHPTQPIRRDRYRIFRFKANKAVVRLLEESRKRGYGLNELAASGIPKEDFVQFAQLIGYSVDGFGTLSYVTDAAYKRAVLEGECEG